MNSAYLAAPASVSIDGAHDGVVWTATAMLAPVARSALMRASMPLMNALSYWLSPVRSAWLQSKKRRTHLWPAGAVSADPIEVDSSTALPAVNPIGVMPGSA